VARHYSPGVERPSPAEYQPPLTPREHVWRYVAMLAISATVSSLLFTDQFHRAWLLGVDFGVGALCYVLVFFRRRQPLAIAVIVNLLTGVSASATGPAVLASVSLATRRRPPEIALLFVVNLLGTSLLYAVQPVDGEIVWWEVTVYNVAAATILIASGMYLGSRRELVWELSHRLERAEADRDEREFKARDTERQRIAQEMHDVLGHRISQISMHAGALSFRQDLSPDELREGAARIQETANAALTDLRGVLGVLRDAKTGQLMDPPQPTYSDVPLLIDSAREAGMRIDFHDGLQGGQPPTQAGRTLFRILQEGLTNAGNHAPGTLVSISVTGRPGKGVDVFVRNALGLVPTASRGSGLGLIGLSERAELAGGRLGHRTEGGIFELHGWIPWAA
jgi:signal transduction histidine kinase